MTGPEHYREAEQLLAIAYSPGSGRCSADRLAAAQAHATLAAAAAAALGALTHAHPSCAAWAAQWADITQPARTEVA